MAKELSGVPTYQTNPGFLVERRATVRPAPQVSADLSRRTGIYRVCLLLFANKTGLTYEELYRALFLSQRNVDLEFKNAQYGDHSGIGVYRNCCLYHWLRYAGKPSSAPKF